VATKINNKDAAKIMFVVGTDGQGLSILTGGEFEIGNQASAKA